jgi:hypothetical protein
MARLPVKSLFCERFGCSPEEYEERAFRKCLYWHAWFLAPLIRLVKPGFFVQDFKFIRYLGDSVGVREVGVDLAEFEDFNRGQPRFLRTGLRIRVSAQKAGRLAYRLIQAADKADAAARLR